MNLLKCFKKVLNQRKNKKKTFKNITSLYIISMNMEKCVS